MPVHLVYYVILMGPKKLLAQAGLYGFAPSSPGKILPAWAQLLGEINARHCSMS